MRRHDAIPAQSVTAPRNAITIGIPDPSKKMFRMSAAAGAMITGRNEATDRSVLRMPKMRPRTSAGSSSCSAVWDGIATNAYSSPASTAMTHDDGDQADEGCDGGNGLLDWRRGPPEQDRGRLDDRQRDEGESHPDQPDIDDEPLRDLLAVRVEEEDADHRAEAGGAHDEEEVLRRESQDVDGEAGADGAQHADQAGRDAQVGEAPGDGPMAAYEGHPLDELVDQLVHRAPGRGGGASDLVVRPDRRQAAGSRGR